MVGSKMRVAMVGAGKFGEKRALAAACHPLTDVVVVADLLEKRAAQLSARINCASTTKWEEAVTRKDVDAVIVCAPTHQLSTISRLALEAGKHVLVEKPFGRSAEEVLPVVELAARKHLRLKVGYNHRYHPALARAYELFRAGAIGRALFLRCCYGHGGRKGYENEWRTQAHLSGGGELLDQGVHALDLFQWFAGPFEEAAGFMTTAFWPIAPSEDNAFVLLRNAHECVAQLHASWTNWKNVFLFEVFGETGSLTVSGLGGNYGPERLCCSSRRSFGMAPEEKWFDFPGEDRSLELEWSDFVRCVSNGEDAPSSGKESLETLRLVDALYNSDPQRRKNSATSMLVPAATCAD
jgi:predicted dehydrogenase